MTIASCADGLAVNQNSLIIPSDNNKETRGHPSKLDHRDKKRWKFLAILLISDDFPLEMLRISEACFNQQWCQRRPKIIPKWSKNRPQIVPKWSQNDPKIVPKSSQIGQDGPRWRKMAPR